MEKVNHLKAMRLLKKGASAVANWIRKKIFQICPVGYLKQLRQRMFITEVGFSGKISDLDRAEGKRAGLKPLTPPERWLLAPIIEIERKRLRRAWRQSVINTTGEDPANWEGIVLNLERKEKGQE